jgi:single-stranded DNA-binding protein
MPWQKIKDLAVVVGSYTDSSGQTKNRYQNVGSILKDQANGNSMILLSRAFNPAGVPFRADKPDQIILSMFDPREEGQTQQRAPARTQSQAPAQNPDADDDIPF